MEDMIKTYGEVEIIVEDAGKTYIKRIKNKVLTSGRLAQAQSLTNQFGSSYQFFIQSMAFGSGGTVGGTTRFIDDTVEGLFPPTILTKPVISNINSNIPNQAIFTSVVGYDDVVGQVINEIGLVMANGSMFSMSCFGDINKTSSMQATFNWYISLL